MPASLSGDPVRQAAAYRDGFCDWQAGNHVFLRALQKPRGAKAEAGWPGMDQMIRERYAKRAQPPRQRAGQGDVTGGGHRGRTGIAPLVKRDPAAILRQQPGHRRAPVWIKDNRMARSPCRIEHQQGQGAGHAAQADATARRSASATRFVSAPGGPVAPLWIHLTAACCQPGERLEHFLIGWNHPITRKMRQTRNLERLIRVQPDRKPLQAGTQPHQQRRPT